MSALASLASKEVIKGIHAKSITFPAVMSTDIVICLQKVQQLILLVGHDCCLFDVVTAIDAQSTRKLHASIDPPKEHKIFASILSANFVVHS